MRMIIAVAAGTALGVGPRAFAGSVDLPVQVGGGYSVPVSSLKEVKFRATVRQQFDFSCGSAALSTLLTYQYGMPVTEEVAFAEMFANGDQAKIRQEGFSLLDIKMFLEKRGFVADGFEAPLEKLNEARIPAIVLLKENGYSHFVIVKGLRDGRVLIGDPAGGTRVMTRGAFDGLWVNEILFVISNRTDIARFNAPSDWSAAPRAPIGDSINRDGIAGTLLPKLGPSDF
ncbi:MAG: C39 family peptidase [Burkholderiaceae bacterium]